MGKLLGGTLMQSDLTYAHVKGKKKDITLTKSEKELGVTVTDNGTGYTFIKRIKENSIFAKHPSIKIGDHIEQIDKQSLVGMKHNEVTEVLKQIPLGSTFKVHLVQPKQTSTTKTPRQTSSTETPRQTTSTGTPEQTAPTGISSEQSHNNAQVQIPSVDLTEDKSCNACQVNEITNPAVVYCKACREFYCPSCRDCHKAFKLTRDHVLVTLSPKPVYDSDLQVEESISCAVNKSDCEETENSSDVIND